MHTWFNELINRSVSPHSHGVCCNTQLTSNVVNNSTLDSAVEQWSCAIVLGCHHLNTSVLHNSHHVLGWHLPFPTS